MHALISSQQRNCKLSELFANQETSSVHTMHPHSNSGVCSGRQMHCNCMERGHAWLMRATIALKGPVSAILPTIRAKGRMLSFLLCWSPATCRRRSTFLISRPASFEAAARTGLRSVTAYSPAHALGQWVDEILWVLTSWSLFEFISLWKPDAPDMRALTEHRCLLDAWIPLCHAILIDCGNVYSLRAASK